MTTLDAIAKRSSTRGYSSEAVSKEDLNKIITAGLAAPTAANKQEICFNVFKGDSEILKEIEDEKNLLRDLKDLPHNFYYEAPIVIIISGDSEYRWSELDAGIAVENMALAAEELGLGSLIIGCIYDALNGQKKDYFSKKIGLKDGYEYKIALAIGYKAVTKEPHEFDFDSHVVFMD